MSPDDQDGVDAAGVVTDEALVVALAKGQSNALSVLYDRYGRLAYALAFRMLGDSAAAEDVVQDAFVAVWRNAARFDAARGSARAWLLTAVRNRAIDVLRGPRQSSRVDDLLDLIQAPDDVWESVARSLNAEDVKQAVEQLPEDQRTTITLAYFDGLTHAQIAAQLRIPLGTVKGRLRLAMEKLREMLAPTGGFPAAREA